MYILSRYAWIVGVTAVPILGTVYAAFQVVWPLKELEI